MTTPASSDEALCLVCGRESCLEAYTHNRISIDDFWIMLRANMRYSRKVELLGSGFKKLFKMQTELTGEGLQLEQSRVGRLLNVLHYWHLLEQLGSLNELMTVLVEEKS